MIVTRRFTEIVLVLLLLVSGCGRDHNITTRSPEALKSYQEGLAQYEKFYYREAVASFGEALRQDSTFAMAWAQSCVRERWMPSTARAGPPEVAWPHG